MKAYDPIPDEPPKKYRWFCTYRDLDPSERSKKAVADKYKVDSTTIASAARLYCWDERCVEWDYELELKRRRVHKKKVEEMHARQSQLAQDMQELAAFELYKLAQKASEMAGENVIHPSVLVSLVKEGAALERLVMGEPGEIIDQRSKVDIDYSKMSVEQIKAIRDALKVGR